MKLLKEPLFHFLLLGALLFGLYAAVSREHPGENRNRITVTASDIRQIKSLFAKQWQRQPTAEELDGLIEGHIREQVFYREALALGLDKEDTIVRRRLVQKMEFIISDVSLPQQPGEEVLRTYYENHPDRYMVPARLSFTHIYFNPDRRGDRAEQEARTVLDTLLKTRAGPGQAGDQGDRFMLEQQYTDRTVDEIARDFGHDFASRLAGMTPAQWHGPLKSGYGIHLVYITQLVPATRAAFDAIREQVKTDYLYDLRRDNNDRVYRKLRDRYEIAVERGD